MKTCNRCDLPKELTEFSKDKSTKDGLRNRCRECMSEIYKKDYDERPEYYIKRATDWASSNPKKRRSIQKKADLKALYGISLEEFQKLSAAQDGKCEICKVPFGEGKLGPHVDHCHTSGQVRALLCSGCNNGLGCFKDNRVSLLSAVEYLKKHSS